MKLGGGEESGGRGRRFPPLGASATALEGVGDGGEYRLSYAVLGRGITRPGSARIVGKFRFLVIAVGGQPRRVGGARGTSVKEDEKKRGRREEKERNAGSERKRKKRIGGEMEKRKG
ncbi:hypothetical protein CDL15_Pgr016543 [Punica granatum]|uniref:Uncharacterized protein n=1 Tax=Punica granatum TaxID=22663 RepID=A0A218WKZ7_PUNGR|nr:hypothetical protein CDL15_Pgr016543 [Punica granatum]